MGTLSYTLPTIGNPNSTEDPLIRTALSAIQTEYNSNVANLLSAYRPLYTVGSVMVAGTGANTYYVTGSNSQPTVASGTGSANIVTMYQNDPTHIAISGYTTKIRLVATAIVNATAPGINFTFGIYPATFAGGATVLTPTLGTVHTSIAINTPAANGPTTSASAEISIPSAGTFVPGVVTSGTIAASSCVGLIWQIQYRYV